MIKRRPLIMSSRAAERWFKIVSRSSEAAKMTDRLRYEERLHELKGVRAVEKALESQLSRELFQERWHTISLKYKPNTLLVINRVWGLWVAYTIKEEKPVLPASIDSIVSFLQDDIRPRKAAKLKLILFGIDKLYDLAKVTNPLRTADSRGEIKRIFMRADNNVRSTKPVNIGLLETILSSLDASDPRDILDAAWISVAYEGLLRAGEIIDLKKSDLSEMENGRLLITLPSKVSGTKPELISLSINTSERLKSWLHTSNPENQNVFCRLSKVKGALVFKGRMDTFDLRVRLEKLLRRLNIESSGYSGSSIHVGAAQDLFLKGVPVTIISQLGRWRNDEMVMKYTRALRPTIQKSAEECRPAVI